MRILLILLVAAPLGAQAPCHEPPPVGWVPTELLERPIDLRDGIGSIGEKVTTTSAEGQKFYDQGLRYLHSFVWIEAARSFHQALRHDSKLAMAYVGLSRAYSGIAGDEAAREMAEKAAKLVEGVSDREKARIELRRLQVDAILHPTDAAKLALYRRKLDEALTRHFDDLELWLIRGNVEDRVPAAGIGQRGTVSSIPIYEYVLRQNPAHFAADHYLVHSFEFADRIDKALAHGAKYAAAAPRVPHAHHMYGHDLRRVGRTREAIDRFLLAERLEMENFAREKMKPEMDWHYPHNLDLLATAYQHQGELRNAEERMRRSYALPAVTDLRAANKKEWPAYLLERGRIDEAEAAAREMTKSNFGGSRAAGYAFVGHSRLRRGDVAAAKEALVQARGELGKVGGLYAEFTRSTLSPFVEMLDGAIALRSGERDAAKKILTGAAARLRAAPGPDAWMQALFGLEAIAHIAREAGDWDLVEFAAVQMLEHDPAYGGTHHLLAEIAARKGEHDAARRHIAEARRLWSFADADLPELRAND